MNTHPKFISTCVEAASRRPSGVGDALLDRHATNQPGVVKPLSACRVAIGVLLFAIMLLAIYPARWLVTWHSTPEKC